jgi:hypothetical protein
MKLTPLVFPAKGLCMLLHLYNQGILAEGEASGQLTSSLR